MIPAEYEGIMLSEAFPEAMLAPWEWDAAPLDYVERIRIWCQARPHIQKLRKQLGY